MSKRSARRKAKIKNKTVTAPVMAIETPNVYTPDSFEQSVIVLGTFFENVIHQLIRLLTKTV